MCKSTRKKSLKRTLVLTLLLTMIPMMALADTNHPEEKEAVAFQKVTGSIQEIQESQDSDAFMMRLEDAEGNPFDLRISEQTLSMTQASPQKGDDLVAYYDARRPMITIYPPQYKAVAYMVESGPQGLFVGIFDESLTDTTHFLRLNISEDTKVMDQQGDPYTESLENQALAVLYSAATKSIPAQTNPELVVVLENHHPTSETKEIDVASMDLIVEGEKLEAPQAWMTEDQVVMVPVGPIAEKLGFNVMWSEELQLVMLSDSITLTIGEDAYVNMKYDDPIEIGQEPVIRNGRSFVPLSFFKDVIPLNNAYVSENQIVINKNLAEKFNEERMD